MQYRHLFKYLPIILLFSSSLLFGESSYSYLITPDFNGEEDLTFRVGLFIEEESTLTIEDIRRRDIKGEIHFDKIIKPNLGISRQTFWVKIKLSSSFSMEEDFFLQIRCPYVNELEGYLFDNDFHQPPEVFYLGRTQLADSPTPPFRYPVIPINLRPNQGKTVYLRMKSTDNIFIDLVLFSLDMFVREMQNSMTLLIIVYGIILSMILFNCILLIGTPSWQMIKYLIYMVFLLLYLLSADGILFRIITFRFPYLAIRSNYFLSISVMVSLLIFTRTYLEIDQRYPRSDKMLNGFIIVSLVLSLFFAVSKTFELLLVVAGTFEVISFAFLFLASLRAALKKQRAAYYYLASWGVLIVLAFLTQLRTLGFLPPGFLTTGSLNIGAAFQVILLSVGIADRMNSLQQDNLRLKTEKERIEEEFQHKTGFFVNIAHELRTPLTLLIGVNEEFLTGKHGETLSRTNPGFLIIRRNLKRIEGLVNRISTIIRIDHRLLVPEKQRINLNTLMQEISTNYYPKGIRENLCFEYFDRTGTSLYAEQDRNLIKSALENVIANAFQYTSEGSITFILDITADHETAIIRVLDTGIGIPPGSVNEIFKRFVRLPEAQTLRKEGLGIGLSMVQQIVALHNGSISINSEHGKGSEFIIRLPLSSIGPPVSKEITLKPIRPPGIKDGSMSINSSNNKSTVLLVEDDADLLEFLSLRLGTVFSVYTATSG
ncbi:MAG: sensor histidine kinase [Spirochaetia bacterium]|jgi:signal transduction histidine kinase|nr:sensor histidine kinase [Spirochaetia bacterium]